MQLSGLHRRHPTAPSFVNHTPRHFEITAPSPPAQFPEMFGQRCDGKSLALGPAYKKETAMGQATSGVERESSSSEPGHHQPSITTIVREDSIQQIDEEPSSPCCTQSRPDSCWSIHCDRTDQAPYALGKHAGEMMTSTSLLGLPRKNPSADLAFFLQTTGPVAPHRRPSKAEHRLRSGVATPTKKALHFLKLRPRRAKKTFVTPYDRLVVLVAFVCRSG